MDTMLVIFQLLASLFNSGPPSPPPGWTNIPLVEGVNDGTIITPSPAEPEYNDNTSIVPPRRPVNLAVTDTTYPIGTRIQLFNDRNVHYGFPIYVGTPQQKIWVSLDTGSSDIWVPSINARGTLSESQRKYDPSKSSTYRPAPGRKDFNIKYGVGNITGLRDIDTISFFGNVLTINDQIFGEALDSPSPTYNEPFDGIFGFGFTNISDTDKESTPMDNLYNQQQITRKLFCVKLTGNLGEFGGELWIGGCNVRAQIWKPINILGFWQILMTGVNVVTNTGQNTLSLCQNGCNALFDTGMGLSGCHQDQLDAIAASVGAFIDSDSGFYVVDCNTQNLPNIQFTFEDVTITMQPGDYLGLQNPMKNLCNIGLRFMEYMYADFLLGDPFLRKLTVIFDRDNNQIGFSGI